MKTPRLLYAVTVPLLAYGLLHWSPFANRAAVAKAGEVRRIGVSLSGAEFGTDKPEFSNRNPGACGREYNYNSPRTFKYFSEQGVNLFRIPVRWERLQPKLGGELDAAEVTRLRAAAQRAAKNGGQVVIDLHNFGRYKIDCGGLPMECAIDQMVGGKVPVTREHFCDLWRRLSRLFRDDAGVHAYGLMNEPHDMGAGRWHAISQAAVDAIRAEGDRKLLLVAGDEWSKADGFSQRNGLPWIADPAKNFAYEAHCYFDRDGSGRYALGYDAELAADPNLATRPLARLAEFADWCGAYGVRGFIGEFGVPGNDARWLPLLEKFVAAMDDNGFDGCCWGAGEWWNDYPLSIQPAAGSQAVAPQLNVLSSR